MNHLTAAFPEAKPYLTTGSRAYLIGGQDGSFPERGEHMPGEMHGLWAPPIKAADGFWLKAGENWLLAAESFEMLPWGCRFVYPEKGGISAERFQFVPDGLEAFQVTFTFHNHAETEKKLPLQFLLKSELMPVWLSDRLGKQDFPDTGRFDPETGVLTLKDRGNPWYLLLSSSPGTKGSVSETADAPEHPSGQGIWASLESILTIPAGESREADFYLAVSSRSEAEAQKNLSALQKNSRQLLEEKIRRYDETDARAALTLSGAPHLAEMYRWTKYVNDWAVREVPGVGRGAVAGYAEFPWWFGHDSTYLLKSFLLTGDYEICRSTSRLVRDFSDRVNGNGRVMHEGVSNGVVFYEGMLSETPQFAEWIWHFYCWTGDREFLEEFYPFLKKGMEWVLFQSAEGLPYGYGALEIGGFNCMVHDCAIHAIRGYEVLAEMAEELGFPNDAKRFSAQFRESLDSFNRLFWLEEAGVYADMAGTREELLERARSWKISLKSFPVEEGDGVYGDESCSFDKTPEDLELQKRLHENFDKIAKEAAQMADGERRAFYCFGSASADLLIDKGYLPADRAERMIKNRFSLLRKPGERPYGDMGIGTSRLMRQFARENRPDELRNALEAIYESFGAVCPGATPEYFPAKGCFIQIWNNEATMSVYTECVLHLENLFIGDARFSFDFSPDTQTLTVTAPMEWELTLEHPQIRLQRQINP